MKFHFFALDDAPENVAWCHDDAPSKFQLLTPTLECSVSHLPGQPIKCGGSGSGGGGWDISNPVYIYYTAPWYLGT